MDTTKVYRVCNNTLGMLYLPAVDELFPLGIRLQPGDNNVPKKYFETLEKHKDSKNYKAAIARLEDPNSYISTDRGRIRGPQITIMSKDADPGPEGPPLPDSLEMHSESYATKLIEIVTEKDALRRWSSDRRANVAQAAKTRISQLGG